MSKQNQSVWKHIRHKDIEPMYDFADRYKVFLDQAKTEREAASFIADAAKEAGFKAWDQTKGKLNPGDRIFFTHKNKAAVLLVAGKKDITEGVDVVGAHLDAPRLDLKPQPLYEDGKLALFKTHYYGGIKKYQWTAMPLALHGVAFTQDDRQVNIRIGDDPEDPVFYITDLLPHLGKAQQEKKLAEAIPAENLNVVCGHAPKPHADADAKHPIKDHVLAFLADKYGLTEDDLKIAELEIVPAQNARDVGFDRSMIAAHGHDDRSCSFAALDAILNVDVPERTAVALFVDKEEIGSVGNTSMNAIFFENALAELLDAQGNGSELALRRLLAKSRVLSADVTAAYDPTYPEVMDEKNCAYLGHGPALNKYTGARGKSGSNDANAEFLVEIRRIFNDADILWQINELGKVDEGGGGTIAYILANRGAEVVDCGVPVLSMHAPIELVSKADMYMTRQAYLAFLEN